MQVKVFEAETMPTALAKVKETLGPDALILSTRTLRKNGLGLIGRPRVEITAAVETNDPQPQDQATSYTPAAAQKAEKKKNPPPSGLDNLNYRDIWKQKKVIDPFETELHDLREMVARQDVGSLRDELNELKSVIRQLNEQSTRSKPQQTALPARQQAQVPRTEADRWISCLTAHDIAPETARALARYAGKRLAPQLFKDPVLMEKFFLHTIGSLVKFAPPLTMREGQQRVALVGPTGVGKTTTIAKLAAEFLRENKGKVALFTIDTYRIAAIEQLKVYGEIMDLPVEVIYSPDQLQAAFDRHNDKDLILIDTSGRSHRDEQGMAELAAFLTPESGTENHLVLATGTRGRDLADIVGSFSRMPLHHLIFSKIDECTQRGALLDIPLRKKLPLSYLTNGQRVPEDLLVADPKLVAECILGRQ